MASLHEILSMLRGQAFGKTWIPDLDLSGKTIVITGANTGLGLECAKHLARLRASQIILACRDLTKDEAAKGSIVEETACANRTDIEVWELDLASFASVLAFGKRVRTQLKRLDAFIANAGVEMQEFKVAEGLELQLTVNVVSCFLCAIAVLPKLRKTAEAHNIDTTLTFCGSMYHIMGPDAELDVPEDQDAFEILNDTERTDIIWRYALTKLIVHHCYHKLAACLSSSLEQRRPCVVANMINPGWGETELSRAKPHPLGERVGFAILGWSAEKGSRAYIHAISAGRDSHGRYLSECQFKQESGYIRSERGRHNEEKIWQDLMRRIEKISPEVAGFIDRGWYL
ncbi:NAD(P)-binding protein [Bimuria novae-zelandiae CBS 107.79]|uniref:NAD(P)-binding protein n=1 Tax=Bimuria novae-zelandiae CBS 107.79 TaxID=1447943 RepID=A0A6A5UZE9_9PLEO|nr:NAD(P)-binding protein [Bimuria novae-zelandiae CBS 107.79]